MVLLDANKPVNITSRPANYVYRGKTDTGTDEWKTRVKYATLESLLKGTGLENSTEFLDEVSLFFDPKHPQHDYSISDYIEVLDRMCDWIFPKLTREAGREAIGRMLFDGRRKTVFGKVALSALHVMGPHRLMSLAPRLFEVTGGVGKRTLTNSGPNQYCFSSRQVAGTYEEEVGAIKAALEEAGAKNLKVVVEVLAPDSWDYHISWD
jgi:uncharacterized protein (TIGR02265 family)